MAHPGQLGASLTPLQGPASTVASILVDARLLLIVATSLRVLDLALLSAAGSPVARRVFQGETNSDVAKKFAIEHKLDQEGMQNVYMFLNQKAAAAGTYKKELGEYMGFEYAGEITPIMVFEDSNAKGIAEFMAVKLGLVRLSPLASVATCALQNLRAAAVAQRHAHTAALRMTRSSPRRPSRSRPTSSASSSPRWRSACRWT